MPTRNALVAWTLPSMPLVLASAHSPLAAASQTQGLSGERERAERREESSAQQR